VHVGGGFGHEVVWVGWWYGYDPAAEADTVIRTRKPVAAHLPRWSDLSDPVFRVRGEAFPPHAGLRDPPQRWRRCYGGPVVAVWYGLQWVDIVRTPGEYEVWGALDLGVTDAKGGRFPRVLPYRLIWRGMLINTVFYALILWLLIPGPFVLRRLIRLKRGRCPKCGYDLRGAPPEVGAGGGCPECGWGRGEPSAARKNTV
jgi:hypothetical protein